VQVSASLLDELRDAPDVVSISEPRLPGWREGRLAPL